MARQKKTDGSGWGFLMVVLAILFIAFAVPTLITWLMYRKYRQLGPDSRGRKLCLFSMIVTGLFLYASGLFFVKLLVLDGYTLKDISTWTPLIAGFCASLPFIALFVIGKRKASAQGDAVVLYKERLGRAIADRSLDSTEVKELNELINKYLISGSSLKAIHRSAYLNALWDATDDMKIDEKEVASLEGLMGQLGISDDLRGYSNEFAQKVNRIDAIINGNLQGIEPPVGFIPKINETCFFYETCELYENVTSSGAFVGVSFRLGNIVPKMNPRIYVGKKIRYDSMKMVDRGVMAITDRRIVFLGDIHNREFTYNKILGLDAGYDGIQIRRDGKDKLEVFRMNALDKEIAVVLIGYMARTKG